MRYHTWYISFYRKTFLDVTIARSQAVEFPLKVLNSGCIFRNFYRLWSIYKRCKRTSNSTTQIMDWNGENNILGFQDFEQKCNLGNRSGKYRPFTTSCYERKGCCKSRLSNYICILCILTILFVMTQMGLKKIHFGNLAKR